MARHCRSPVAARRPENTPQPPPRADVTLSPLARRLSLQLARYALAVLALTLPLALFAQLTRALPLLYAAAPAGGDTVTLVACALSLLAIALTPPALCVASAIVAARLAESGGVRALASHGVARAQIVALLRAPAGVCMVVVSSLGVLCEPSLASHARAAVTSLGARAVAGSLAQGAQIEPIDGVVMAAPGGARGPLYVARTTERQVFLRAARFAITPGDGVSIALSDVSVRAETAQLRAARVAWTMGAPAPDETLLAGELTAPLSTREIAPLRRHAARAYWGAMAFVAVMLSASIALSERAGERWRVALASVGSLAAVAVSTRAAWAVLESLHSVASLRAAMVAMAAMAVGLAEGVARRR